MLLTPMKMKNKNNTPCLLGKVLAIVCGILWLGIDQFTKYVVTQNFTLGERKEFLNGFLDFVYIHNRGAAWGIFTNKTWFLVVLTAVVMAICIVVLIKFANNKLLFWAITLVISGGIGNMLDRILRNGNVVDFLHFEFWPTFPVFNIADCAIVLGAGLLILYFVIDTAKDLKNKNRKGRNEDANG